MMMTTQFRRKAFRAAVAAAGYKSVKQWAADFGKHENQVYMVLNGARPDPKTLAVVDTFIVETLLPFSTEIKRELTNLAARRPVARKKVPA